TKVINTPSQAKTALDRAKQKAKAKDDLLADEPQVKPTEVGFKMTGVAPTDVQVAQFMTALGRSPLFRDVALVFSEQVTIEKQELRRFRIELKLNPDVDMRDMSPKRVPRNLAQD